MIKLVFYIDKSGRGILQSNSLDTIREYFSMKDPMARFKQRKIGITMPSRMYAITPTGRFRLGMFADIVNYVKSTGSEYNMIVSQEFKRKFFCGYKATKNDIVQLKIPLRDYQVSTIMKDLKLGHGTNVVATAGGKTLIMASLVQSIRNLSTHLHRTLIIVPGIQLVEQTANDFIEYGIPPSDISKWSGENDLNPKAPIIIAGMNILQSKNTDINMYKNTDLLIMDECIRGGQLIKTSIGNKKIEDIKIGDLVLSYNINYNVNEYRKVTKTHKNMVKSNSYNQFIQITLDNNKIIEVTPNHKIYTTNRGYVRADELSEKDDIKIL